MSAFDATWQTEQYAQAFRDGHLEPMARIFDPNGVFIYIDESEHQLRSARLRELASLWSQNPDPSTRVENVAILSESPSLVVLSLDFVQEGRSFQDVLTYACHDAGWRIVTKLSLQSTQG